jgi:hypothetical protein
VLLRERWQMEMLSKLWKQYGRIDEWRTANPWRVLCELYAKLIGLLLQHWLIILFAQAGMNSAVWSSWRRWCAIPPVLSWKLWQASARFALSSKAGSARMRSGCQMNKREARIPASPAGLDELGPGPLSWCEWGEKCRDPYCGHGQCHSIDELATGRSTRTDPHVCL